MEIKEEVKTVRYIEYDGKRFYEDGKGYWLGQIQDEQGVYRRIRLHIYVWEKHNGPVPDGYDIHHIDHDTSNNSIENLALIERSAHHALHMAERDRDELRRIMKEYVQPAAVKWHKSDEGAAWHRKQYQQTLGDKWSDTVTLECLRCGKPFTTSVLMRDKSKFCSNRCKTAYRYHSGADNVSRTCPICGAAFTVNKYSRTKTCSKECGAKMQSKTKRG